MRKQDPEIAGSNPVFAVIVASVNALNVVVGM